MLAVDKNLFKNEEHLKKILEGKCTSRLENLNDPLYNKNQTLNVLKRREQMMENKKNSRLAHLSKGVDMIGCGNTYDSQKVKSLLAKQKYLTEMIQKEKTMSQSRKLNHNFGNGKNLTDSSQVYAKQTKAIPGDENLVNKRVSQSYSRNRGSRSVNPVERPNSRGTNPSVTQRNSRVNFEQYPEMANSRQIVRDSLSNVADFNEPSYRSKRGSRRSHGYMSNSQSIIILF